VRLIKSDEAEDVILGLSKSIVELEDESEVAGRRGIPSAMGRNVSKPTGGGENLQPVEE
jgi:hypothetical protein